MAHFDHFDQTRQLEALGLICKVVSVNPASINAGAEGTATANVAGLQPSHRIFATIQADVTVGLYLRGARCVTPGVATFDYANHSAGAIDEAAHNVAILAVPGDLN